MAATSNHNHLSTAGRVTELQFSGDNVLLSGQIDYPNRPIPAAGFPLLFILHHAGTHTRDDVAHLASVALSSGWAAFRWDKRGSGRSGGGGRGSTLIDAVKAYEIALKQLDIHRGRVCVVAHADGTAMLRDMYSQIDDIARPYAALLIANMLDKREILRLTTRLMILMGERDWLSSHVYGKEASETHSRAYAFGAQYAVIPHANRLLEDTRTPDGLFHGDAIRHIKEWLQNLD